jgi:molecular chaperone GrpE
MVDDAEKCGQGEPAPADETQQTNVNEAAEAPKPNLEERLALAQTQAAENLESWRRTAADFSNYRKRTEREREDARKFSNGLLLGKLLPILDDLERAMYTLPDDLHRLTWVEGVALIERKLHMALESEGLKEIASVGQPFDPNKHEALMREETTSVPDGQVLAEFQRGYELHGRVLRPALVKVAAAPATPPAPPETPAPPEEPTGA